LISRAILDLRLQPTTNLQVRLDQDYVIGGQTFEEGTLLNTGLDVPAGWIMPLGVTVRLNRGNIQAGVTCAMCHSTVDMNTGLVVEGATNLDVDAGMIIAFASNTAAMFRHTDVDPAVLPPGVDR
jgi:hypothetical protein